MVNSISTILTIRLECELGPPCAAGRALHSHSHPIFSLDDHWVLYNALIGSRHNIDMADVNSLT